MRLSLFLPISTLLLVVFLTGCETTSSSSMLMTARREYDARRYEAAYEHALIGQRYAVGENKQDASYLAGIAAYRLGKLDDAEKQLLAATRTSTGRAAPLAEAMLGIIRLDQSRSFEAAQYFRKASDRLTGDNARRASLHALLAEENSGLEVSSTKTYVSITGSSRVSERPIRSPGREFSLQVGAFRDRTRARSAANTAQELAKDRLTGRARVVSQRDDRGRELFLVQIGQFSSRREAMLARTELGRLDYIVTLAALRLGSDLSPTAYP